MKEFSIEDILSNFDSIYRLVIVASRRANQVSKPEVRPLVHTISKKPTVIAIEEIVDGKVSYHSGETDEEDYV